ncbi:HAD-IA family hydrolase [Propionibacteriaceae bacterium G57]|uniref:HAD-IA family hydrolase n=1 Tax=Aestuariimicrobium sp. G57 TaxID=3418485 RepID=UPI003DA75C87
MPADTPHQPQHLEALLFDFDGTLVNTEPVWCDVEVEMMRERGGHWTYEDAAARNGHTVQSTVRLMLDDLGDTETSPEDLQRELSERVVAAVRDLQPDFRPGILELLAEARAAGVPCAVVTSSPKLMTDAVLPRLPDDQFGVVITHEVPRNLKPHPEPYQLAAQRLGVDIRKCVVVEDSDPGAIAGEAAGAVVVGCPAEGELHETQGRVVVSTMAGVDLRWLDELVGDRYNETATLSGVRRGPLLPGERVTLTDPKGRRHSLVLVPGKTFHTTKGGLDHDEIIGQPEGIVATTVGGLKFMVMRPLLSEFTTTMPREAAVIYPKDAAQIVMWADIFPGARVLEAGVGSGALSLSLLRAIGAGGRLSSYERREDFAKVARRNVESFLGREHPAWTITVGDLVDEIREEPVDRVILDMLAPWECIDAVGKVLEPGGVLCCYVATATQLGRVADTLRVHGGFTEPSLTEVSVRDWHAEGLAIRPGHGTSPHTGFLVISRRLAPGITAPARKRRPAPGAYGPDYTGPRPAGVEQPAE